MIWFKIIIELFSYLILFYSAALILFNMCMGLYSFIENMLHLRKNNSTDYNLLSSSPHAPSLSIIAPAYNEGKTIIENIRSLLSIYYNNLEIIIVNDGSSDDSLQKIVEAYELRKVKQFVQYILPTKAIRNVYKSSNPIYKKLIVIDKENGGKADSLNAGINISTNDFIISIDVDCILEEDALLKIIKPILEETSVQVIASGGVVRIANSCHVEDGKLVKVKLPSNYLARVQTLEYMRAFLLGRMAWSRMNGLLLISGAFGAFDKDLVIKCGGYNAETIGEDMELVVRMRRYMQERNLPYVVKYVPDPLCWTEAPSTFAVLGRQRNRWMRGALETLKAHKILFFNKQYGLMGMVSYPYWVFFEVLGPIIECLGILVFISGAIFGIVKWKVFFTIIAFLISFSCLYSTFAVLMEVLSYHQYKRRTDVLKLLLAALTEPFLFHPFVVYANVCGIIDFLRKKKAWGVMTRSGFDNKTIISPNLLYGLEERKQ